MRRLIFCFDGSWNRINTDGLTNVALTASAISRYATVRDGDDDLIEKGFKVGDRIPQIVHYDEGVGTNRNEKYGGGMFGKGLFANVREAYLFLCLNYEPGDELYLFGFSRGAYTARSFAGLVGNCGIMRSEHIEKVIEAANLYQRRGAADTEEERAELQAKLFELIRHFGHPVTTCQAEDDWKRGCHGLEDHQQPRVDIRYMGLWDTVKSIFTLRGVLEGYDPDTEFHDDDIPECAESGRHAVALDEHRKPFDCTLWHNIDEANRWAWGKTDKSVDFETYRLSEDRAFKEVWFPGVHGAVGGGGERRGLSDDALLWVLEGARKAGLAMNTEAQSKVFQLRPTPIAYIDNTEADGKLDTLNEIKSAITRRQFVRSGPTHISEVSDSTIARYAAPPDVLPEEEERKTEEPYRPEALAAVEADVIALAAERFTAEDFRLYNGYDDSDWETIDSEKIESGWRYVPYTVKQGDQLSTIARDQLGDPMQYKTLQACNKVMVPDANVIHPGMVLNIPQGRVED